MNQQEAHQIVFNKVWQRAKTKKKSEIMHEDGPLCCYRKDGNGNNLNDENCCFIGPMISPEEYDPKFDSQMALLRIKDHLKPDNPLKFCCHKFLIALQSVHDQLEPYDWEDKLRQKANYWKVEIPE